MSGKNIFETGLLHSVISRQLEKGIKRSRKLAKH